MVAEKVAVAMSGGVDSSVAATLLKREGQEIIAVYMRVWSDNAAKKAKGMEDAREVARQLDIPFHVLDMENVFRKEVIDDFIEEYAAGRTPNPCILCNRRIKFNQLLKESFQLGADYLATGHYARLEMIADRWFLKRGRDLSKDQSYTLYNLQQKQMAHIKFPLGYMLKKEVRELAKDFNLKVSGKEESQEICFIADDDHGKFISKERPDSVIPGNIVDEAGKVLGKHKGLPYYTVGQRKGLGLALGEPVYVKELRPDKNELVVGPKENIYSPGLLASNLNWVAFSQAPEEIQAQVQIRYNARPKEATIKCFNDRAEVFFFKPQIAVTPGQSAVFYDGDVVLGGGIIERPLK